MNCKQALIKIEPPKASLKGAPKRQRPAELAALLQSWTPRRGGKQGRGRAARCCPQMLAFNGVHVQRRSLFNCPS